MHATWPLEEEFCRTMLLMHWPNWRSLTDIKDPDVTWKDQFNQLLQMTAFPNFVKSQVDTNSEEAEDSDADDTEVFDQPEWMELIKSMATFEDIQPDAIFNKTNFTNLYPPTKGYLRETCKSQNINPIYLTLSSPSVSSRS